jgi:hypothetical protein
MYEDIEIMRRILRNKLLQYGSTRPTRINALSDCASCHGDATHGSGVAWGDFDADGDEHPDLVVAQPHGKLTLFRNTGEGKFTDVTAQSGLGVVHGRLTTQGSPALDLEGVYLPGQGVIYTVTMPPPPRDPRPAATPASDKPLSDWDRARKEIRNEKPAPEQSKLQPREPALADIILKVLADNGKHFTLLKPEETLTVAVTFRPVMIEQPLAVFHDISDSGGQSPASGGGKSDTDKQSGTAAKPATTARDYLLLGDLHLKQGKAQDAITSYQMAAKLKPELAEEPSILERVAQAELALGHKDQAAAMIVRARKLRDDSIAQRNKNTQTGDAPAAPLPAKLIISATKKLLDQVGNGQISYEAFKKEAHVEYLTFSAQQK